MALHTKNEDVDALARRLVARVDIAKTEDVRVAVGNEPNRASAPNLVEAGVAFCRDLVRNSPLFSPGAPDKTFIDSLYETD